ncbi:hypothetical protein FKW77_006685 [Venturia effusa]|uniref:Uncharacterized protein n=1 Tax=Venturia effusa TaxID=50376 RepID=A0A517LDY7_9PEZI|nr:hypothetical protein FKW77_006685 [Venturia effusa]
MALSNLVPYESESESSPPQFSDTRPDAETEKTSRLHHEEDVVDGTSMQPLRAAAQEGFCQPIKRDRVADNPDDDVAEAMEKPDRKRQRKGDSGAYNSGQAIGAGVSQIRIITKTTMTQKVVETKELVGSEDATDVTEENEEELSSVADDERSVIERGKKAGKEQIEQSNGEDDGPGDDGLTLDFFKDLYHTRFGLLNLGRLAMDTRDDPAYTIHPEKTKVKQTDTQKQLQSFFRQYPDIRNAKRRLEFIKPYMDRTQKDKKKRWSALSLIMRLNLIASIREVENIKHGKGKTWEDLCREAKTIRVQCENAQYHMKDPWDWEQYNESKGLPHHEICEVDKSLDEQLDDGLLALGGYGPNGEDEDDGDKEEEEDAKSTIHSQPQTKANAPFKWEHFTFTPTHQTAFNALCHQNPIPDVAPNRKPDKGQWKAEEFRFGYEWMTFKGPSADWKGNSADVSEIGLAHKAFFTDFEFRDGKRKSLCRGGRAIVRQLRKAGGEGFVRWLSRTEGKGRGRRSDRVGVDIVVDDEGGENEGGDKEGGDDEGGDDKGGDDERGDDEVGDAEAVDDKENAVKNLKMNDEKNNNPQPPEKSVESNTAGRPTTGRKSTAAIKQHYEEKTGQKLIEMAGGEENQGSEEVEEEEEEL